MLSSLKLLKDLLEHMAKARLSLISELHTWNFLRAKFLRSMNLMNYSHSSCMLLGGCFPRTKLLAANHSQSPAAASTELKWSGELRISTELDSLLENFLIGLVYLHSAFPKSASC